MRQIFLPPEQVEFSVDDEQWTQLSPLDEIPAQLQHIPSSLVFAVTADIPENPAPGATFYPMLDMYAVLIHVSGGAPAPSSEIEVQLGRGAVTWWLKRTGFLLPKQ